MSLRYLIYIVILFAYSLMFSSAQATQIPVFYPATLIKVIDGDTVKLRLEIYPDLFKQVNLRIFGIDTPESRNGVKGGQKISECEVEQGKKATAFAQTTLAQSPTLVVTNIDPDRTKYAGRMNGQLLFVLPGAESNKPMDFGLYMIEKGFAENYNGGVRTHWPCE